MSSEPWLTIVTVVRNDESALLQTFGSVADQNANGIEHLIVDGASTDSTIKVAEDHAADNPAIRVSSEPDRGIYDAMNKAISLSRGRHIHYLNAGDVYAGPDTLSWLARQLRERPTDWLRTPVQFVDTHGAASRRLQSAELQTRRFVNGRQPVFHQGAIMTRSLLTRLGGFRIQYAIAADYDLMRRALATDVRPSIADHVLVHVDDAGVSTQHWPHALYEVHCSRSSPGGATRTARSFATMTASMAVVASRRLARRGAQAVLSPDLMRQLRRVEPVDRS